MSAPGTGRAASSPVCTVTVSRSPPNDCPVVTVAASQPASRSTAEVRENHAGRAPPSCITYTTRGAPPPPTPPHPASPAAPPPPPPPHPPPPHPSARKIPATTARRAA